MLNSVEENRLVISFFSTYFSFKLKETLDMTVVSSLARTAISTNPHTTMTTYDYTSVTTLGFIRSLNHVERKFSDIRLRQILIHSGKAKMNHHADN